jgi:hypothetical protein
VSAGLSLLWTGAVALIVVSVVRWRAGFVAIPGIGRQPFIVVVGVCWALAAFGALVPALVRSPVVLVAAGPVAASGLLLFLRGRELTATGQRDPLGDRRKLFVAAHVVVIAGVVLLAATGQV